MSKRQILFIVLAILVPFVVVLLIFIGIYNYYPEYLGLPPKKPDTTEIKEHTPVIPEKPSQIYIFTKEEYDKLLLKQTVPFLYKYQIENLNWQNFFLKDTLEKLTLSYRKLIDSLNSYSKKLSSEISANKSLNDTINKLHNFLAQKNKDYENLKDLFNKLKEKKIEQQKLDSLYTENIITFAKILNNSEPTEIAKILLKLPAEDAAKILKTLQVKKAGKVLDNLPADSVSKIIKYGVKRSETKD